MAGAADMELRGVVRGRPRFSEKNPMWSVVQLQEEGTGHVFTVKGIWPWPVKTTLTTGTPLQVRVDPQASDSGFGAQYALRSASLRPDEGGSGGGGGALDALAAAGITPVVGRLLVAHYGEERVIPALQEMCASCSFAALSQVRGMTPLRIKGVQGARLGSLTAATDAAAAFPGLTAKELAHLLKSFASKVGALKDSPFNLWACGVLTFERACELSSSGSGPHWDAAHIVHALHGRTRKSGDTCMPASAVVTVSHPLRVVRDHGSILVCFAPDGGNEDDEDEDFSAGVSVSDKFHLTSDGDYVYTVAMFRSESKVVDFIKAARVADAAAAAADDAVDERLDQVQALAVRRMLACRLSVLTGGAGTGKTHVISAARAMHLRAAGAQVLLLAPTGSAAMRMQKLAGAGARAYTIHSVLMMKQLPVRGRNVLAIVDEASMIDTHLMGATLELAAAHGWRVALVGDVNQLPPIAAGAPMQSMLALGELGALPCTKLERNYRMAGGDGGGAAVAAAASEVLQGRPPPDAGVKVCASAAAVEDAVMAALQAGPRAAAQVLANTNAQCHELSLRIREARLPGVAVAPPAAYGHGKTWRWAVGDDVVITKNKYVDRTVGAASVRVLVAANGTRGVVVGFKTNAQMLLAELHVRVLQQQEDGAEAEVLVYYAGVGGASDLKCVSPAYAITVHKAQGSEYPCVVYAAYGHFGMERKYVYTGLTRARAACTLVTTPGFLEVAVGTVDPPRLDRVCARCC